MERSSGQLYRVTRLKTGVSGITAMSPAMSVASQNGAMMMSVYNDGQYTGFRLTADEAEGTPLALNAKGPDAPPIPPAPDTTQADTSAGDPRSRPAETRGQPLPVPTPPRPTPPEPTRSVRQPRVNSSRSAGMFNRKPASSRPIKRRRTGSSPPTFRSHARAFLPLRPTTTPRTTMRVCRLRPSCHHGRVCRPAARSERA